VAAIVLLGDLTDERKKVNRRQVDNLPSHIKGQAYFEDYSGSSRPYNTSTGYYLNRPKKKHCAVEFVQVEGEDFWTSLHWSSTEDHWYTARPALIPRNNQWGLGWWSLNDPQHPDYANPEEFAEASTEGPHLPIEAHPGPEEEILAGGLHHIVTLGGTSPLSPQEPILPQIEQAVAQGISIPVDVTPAAQILPPITVTTSGDNTLKYIPMSQPAQASVSQSGQTITVTTTNGGGLKGTPPQPFEGDRDKSHAFLVTFGIF